MNHKTSKRILLAVTGMSPQVVTETLYALSQQPEPWMPDEIHLMSTSEGCRRAENELLHPDRDIFGQFCREYLPGMQIKFGPEQLHVFKTPQGEPIRDIHDLSSSGYVADDIAAMVRELTAEANTEVHASIAGGRKSMGFLLGYAMSMYGRKQDRLSHVLVTEGFENHPQFYYPPRKSRILDVTDRSGKITNTLNTDDAKVMLAELPFVRLRGMISPSKLNAPLSFKDLVNEMQGTLEAPSVTVDLARQELICGGTPVHLERLEIALYAYACHQRKNMNGGFNCRCDSALMTKMYRLARTNIKMGADPEKDKELDAGLEWDKKKVQEYVSKINRTLGMILGLVLCAPYQLTLSKPGKEYCIALPAESIRIPGID